MISTGVKQRLLLIADTLHITEGTVKVHLHNIYEKLGVEGRVELTLYARDHGWV